MTTESVAPEVLHAWAVYLRASEEARRRGDRRTPVSTTTVTQLTLPAPARLACTSWTAERAAGMAPSVPHGPRSPRPLTTRPR